MKKTEFHYLTYCGICGSMVPCIKAYHMQCIGTVSFAHELPNYTADSVGKSVSPWAYGGQPQLAGHHLALAFCEPGKKLVDLYAFVCCGLRSAAWPNVGESVADHSCYYSVCPHSSKQKHQRLRDL